MPYCEYPADFMPFDITPVENLFLMEHMPHAPGDYVRVYLYGLMLCRYPGQDSSELSVAHALGIRPEEVADAFRYWEGQGLVVRLSDKPPRYQYISPQRALLENADPTDGVYRYREFFASLQEIFGADRLLTPQEQGKAIEWVETLGLPETVVLQMVRAQVAKARAAKRSLRYIFRDLGAMAEQWSREGIVTPEAAAERIARDSAAARAAEAVCRQLNLRRAPTLDEIALAEKWTGEWGIAQKEILSACAKMTSATNPSFAYLDSILSRQRKGDGESHTLVREVLRALGGTGTPAAAQEEAYAAFLAEGFDHEAILFAAGQCATQGRHSFDDLQGKLARWKRAGITTREAAEEFARRREPGERIMSQAYDIFGFDRRPDPEDIALGAQLALDFPPEVILFAAERARGKKSPVAYMRQILGNWQKAGIHDLAGAQREAEAAPTLKSGQDRPSAAPGKSNPAREYRQREYDSEQMRHIAMGVEELTGGEADGK